MGKFIGMLLPGAICCLAGHASQVTLAWNRSSDPSIAGYNVYYGGASGQYTHVVNVSSPLTNAVIPGLVAGATSYFVVTALNTFGLESDFSGEISYLVPAIASLQVSPLAGGMFRLTIAGVSGHSYQIQASTNLITWTNIGTQIMGSNGSFTITDSNAPKYKFRFYRTYDPNP